MADNILRSYTPQVAPVRDAGIRLDNSNAFAELGGVGRQAVGMASQYIEKMAAEKSIAQDAEHKANLRLSWDAAEKQMASMTDADEIKSFYEDWEQQQKDALGEAKLTPAARASLDNYYQGALAGTRISATGMGGYADKAEIKKMDGVWARNAALALTGDTGDFETSQELYNYSIDQRMKLGSISPAKGAEMKIGFETSQNRAIQSLKVSEAERALQSGDILPEQYMGILEQIKAENRELKMETTGGTSLDSEINYKIAKAKGTQNRMAEKTLKSMRIKLEQGDFDSSDLIEVSATLGPAFADAVRNNAVETINDMKYTDADARKVADILGKAAKGDLDWAAALKKVDAVGGSVAVAGSLALADLYVDMSKSENGGDVLAYDNWYNGKIKISSKDSYWGRVIGNVADLSTIGGGDASFVKKSFQAAARWKEDKTYNGQKIETEKEFFSVLFGDKSYEIASQTPAVRVEESPPMEGARKAPDGKWYVEKEGKFYEVMP